MPDGHDEVVYLERGGLKRRYVLHRPPALASAARPAAVIMLDGRGGTPWTAMKSTGWSRKADAEGFLAVYPEATRLDPHGPLHFLDNPQMWNAGAGGSDTAREGVDDAGFLRDVVEDLAARFGADRRRMYMTGFSNGASMTFRFAAGHPHLVAAIAPVAGYCRVREERLPRPVPAAIFFGRADPLTPFEGGPVRLPWGVTELRPPARETIRTWVRACGAEGGAFSATESAGVRVERHGPDVVAHMVEDLGHVWPGGHRLLPEKLVGRGSDRLSATDEAWAFFRERSRA
jgi:polyhydroxybutyrate depolymerase